MKRMMALALLTLGLVAQVVGCARHQVTYSGSWHPGVAPTEPADMRAETERGPMSVDVSAVPASAELEPLAGQGDDSRYIALTAEQTQCLAAANATLANLSAMDMSLAASLPGRGLGAHQAAVQQAAAVKSDLLALRALDERNRAAGQALEMYYQLFEAEASIAAVKRSLAELDRIIADLESLRAKGLKVPVDVDELRTQKIELLDKQAEARLAIARLNSGLRAQLGVSRGETRRFWPGDELTVDPQRVDIDAAVAEGLAMRPDLALVRMLSSTLSRDTLPAVQSALQSAGMSSLSNRPGSRLWAPLIRWLTAQRTSLELSTRSQQLAQLAVDGERAAAEEIRSAAEALDTRLAQVALAKETLESRKRQEATLEKKRTLGDATPLEVVEAKLHAIEAEHELVHRVVAWEIARVKLKQSQGLLVAECGGGVGGGFGACVHAGPCEYGEHALPFEQSLGEETLRGESPRRIETIPIPTPPPERSGPALRPASEPWRMLPSPSAALMPIMRIPASSRSAARQNIGLSSFIETGHR